MVRFFRPVLAGLAASFIASAALAASSSTPIGYTPDPALKTASISDLTRRVQKACVAIQIRVQNGVEQSYQRPCGCYAGKAMKSFSAAEIQDYRDSGVFNASARGKALQAIDACGLQRPI